MRIYVCPSNLNDCDDTQFVQSAFSVLNELGVKNDVVVYYMNLGGSLLSFEPENTDKVSSMLALLKIKCPTQYSKVFVVEDDKNGG